MFKLCTMRETPPAPNGAFRRSFDLTIAGLLTLAMLTHDGHKPSPAIEDMHSVIIVQMDGISVAIPVVMHYIAGSPKTKASLFVARSSKNASVCYTYIYKPKVMAQWCYSGER